MKRRCFPYCPARRHRRARRDRRRRRRSHGPDPAVSGCADAHQRRSVHVELHLPRRHEHVHRPGCPLLRRRRGPRDERVHERIAPARDPGHGDRRQPPRHARLQLLADDAGAGTRATRTPASTTTSRSCGSTRPTPAASIERAGVRWPDPRRRRRRPPVDGLLVRQVELRLGITQLSPKQGVVIQVAGGGWSRRVLTVTPGIPGDSGSGLMNAAGEAIGVVSTLMSRRCPPPTAWAISPASWTTCTRTATSWAPTSSRERSPSRATCSVRYSAAEPAAKLLWRDAERRHRPRRHEDPGRRRRRAARRARAGPQRDADEGRPRRRHRGAHPRRCARRPPRAWPGAPSSSRTSASARRAPWTPRTGPVSSAKNLPGWAERYPPPSSSGKALGTAVVLGNDVQVATDAEAALGAGRGYDSMLGVFWGTGVGRRDRARRPGRGWGAAARARSATSS